MGAGCNCSRLAGFFRLYNFAALVITTFGTYPVRQFLLVAIRTFRSGTRGQIIMSAASRGPCLRVPPFGIWHFLKTFPSRAYFETVARDFTVQAFCEYLRGPPSADHLWYSRNRSFPRSDCGRNVGIILYIRRYRPA